MIEIKDMTPLEWKKENPGATKSDESIVWSWLARRGIITMRNEITDVYLKHQAEVAYINARHNFAFRMTNRACGMLDELYGRGSSVCEGYGFDIVDCASEEPRRITFIIGRTRKLMLYHNGCVWKWSADDIMEEKIHWGGDNISGKCKLGEALYQMFFRLTEAIDMNMLGSDFFELVENDKTDNFYLRRVGYTVDEK